MQPWALLKSEFMFPLVLTEKIDCQSVATIFVTTILVLVGAVAFMAAPTTGQRNPGLAAGIVLVVFSVFQLIPLALVAAFARNRETLMPLFRLIRQPLVG